MHVNKSCIALSGATGNPLYDKVRLPWAEAVILFPTSKHQEECPTMSQTKDINWPGIPLLTENALHEKLAGDWASVSAFLKKHSAAAQELYSMP